MPKFDKDEPLSCSKFPFKLFSHEGSHPTMLHNRVTIYNIADLELSIAIQRSQK